MPWKPRSDENLDEHFWSRVDKTSDTNGCWLWLGCISSGYGRIYWKGKHRYTHVIAYILSGHTISEDLDLSHSELCVGKKHCCNPAHLTQKTHSENNRDQHRDGTMNQAILTANQVIEILNKPDQTQIELAREYGVSRSTIYKIRANLTWVHIPRP